jgi:hypothetical protein
LCPLNAQNAVSIALTTFVIGKGSPKIYCAIVALLTQPLKRQQITLGYGRIHSKIVNLEQQCESNFFQSRVYADRFSNKGGLRNGKSNKTITR